MTCQAYNFLIGVQFLLCKSILLSLYAHLRFRCLPIRLYIASTSVSIMYIPYVTKTKSIFGMAIYFCLDKTITKINK